MPSLANAGLVGALVVAVPLLLLAAVYILSTAIKYNLSQRLRTPPADLDSQVGEAIDRYKTWQDKQHIEPKTGGTHGSITNNTTTSSGGPPPQLPSSSDPFILLPSYGSKTAAARRRLILASKQPSHYSTFFGNFRLTIAAADALSKDRFQPAAAVNGGSGDGSTHSGSNGPAAQKTMYGFFHPYAGRGTPRERVLWTAVKATLSQNPGNICVIYTGHETSPVPLPAGKHTGGSMPIPPGDWNRPTRILAQVHHQFGLVMPDPDRVIFVYLANRKLVDGGGGGRDPASSVPFLSTLLRAVGSMMLAYEALGVLVPDVFVDTAGFAFAYPLVAWLVNVPVVSYVHAPQVLVPKHGGAGGSDDNGGKKKKAGLVRRAWMRGCWTGLALVYAFVGSYASVVMANGTWTQQHMQRLWWIGKSSSVSTAGNSSSKQAKDSKSTSVSKIELVFPPCDVGSIGERSHPGGGGGSAQDIVYIAPFRPQKQHELVMTQFAAFLKSFNHQQKEPTNPQKHSQHHPQHNTTPNNTNPNTNDDITLTPTPPPPKLVMISTLCNPIRPATDYSSAYRTFDLSADDNLLIYNIRLLARELGLIEGTHFEVHLNWSHTRLNSYLKSGRPRVCVNAEVEEPFAVEVVQAMGAGVVPVVHKSGGALVDIVVPWAESSGGSGDDDDLHASGFLFGSADSSTTTSPSTEDPSLSSSPTTLAAALTQAFETSPDELAVYSKCARAAAARFSEARFVESWKWRLQTVAEMSLQRAKSRKATGLYD